MHDNVTRLANLPLISVCLVRGRAIGGGAELTLSTDFRVFAPTGKLNFVQARLGVLPGWAGGSKLVSLTICVKQFVIISLFVLNRLHGFERFVMSVLFQ
jgi:enoyl-CoA hydratase/carnithine racemase